MSKIRHVHMGVADNGFIINFTEITKGDSDGDFDEGTHHHRELVFKSDEDDQAMAKFKELAMKERGITVTVETTAVKPSEDGVEIKIS